jgi:ABC-2 type transport system ATP-binding protein
MIEAKNLTMAYGTHRAVDDVSFKIGEKEIVGLLGPNGAGKTTLMRVLTTFIHPTRGSASVAGFDVTERALEARRAIGYLPETPPLYTDMRVDEYVDFTGRARGLRGGALKSRKDWVVQACGISPVWKHAIHELSLGFRQRVGLAQALIHDPRVVILDEPTSGLDPLQIIGIRALVKQLAQTKTILFSTHILQEAAAISDRLFILNNGRIAAKGTVGELQGSESSLENAFLAVFRRSPARAETG